jgi:hypothetical protein
MQLLMYLNPFNNMDAKTVRLNLNAYKNEKIFMFNALINIVGKNIVNNQ